MSLVQGINKITNKTNTLNIDDEGNLKIDESGILSQLSQTMNYLKNFTIDNDIRYLRNQGNCYMTTYGFVGTSALKTPISLWNPSGSGKTLYVYRINASIDNDASNDYATRLILYSAGAQTTGGTAGSKNNLKLSGGASSATVLNNFSYTTKTELMVLLTGDEPTGGAVLTETFEFPECIEIAEGEGIFTIVYCNTNTTNMRVANTFFWIELDSTVNYPNVSL